MRLAELIKILGTFDPESTVNVVSEGMDRMSEYDLLRFESKVDSTTIVVRCVP